MANSVFINKSFITLSIENRYCLAELTNKMACGGFRSRKDLFLFRLSHFGYRKMGELNASFGYCREFSRKFAAGLQFHYLLDYAHQYDKRHSFTVEVSASARISDKLQIGVAIFNPIALKYGVVGKQVIPVTFKSDMGYKIGAKCLLRLQFAKEQPGGFNCFGEVNLGILNCILAVGVGNRNAHLVFVISYKKFIFQFQSKYSFRLGYSPEVGGHYLF